MTTPSTNIGLANVNVELNHAAETARNFNDGIFRNLTGSQPITIANTAVSLSDLLSKTAFGGIISPNSNTVTSYGVIEREIALVANTDMYSPTVVWSANVITGATGVFTSSGKNASYKLTGTAQANVVANVQITATLSFQGHTIGTASKYINFAINSLPSVLFVAGNTTANSVMFEATSASTTLTATSNVAGGVINFTITPTDAGVFVSGNTVTLSAQSLIAGQDNVRSYSVKTELFFDGQLLETDIKPVSVRAYYTIPDFDYIVPSTSNNVFANSGIVRSSMTLSTSHIVPGANMAWTATKVSGDDAVLTVAANLASANLHINVASGVFQTKKSVYDVTAKLQYANGDLITSKTQRLTLRTGAYGLTFSPAANVTASGYNAQTAIATTSASYQAGTLTWDIAQVSGAVASVSNTVIAGSGSVTMTLSRSSVGAANSVNRVNPVLTFDGIVMANVASQTKVLAEQLAYTFLLSGATSNTQLDAAPVISTLATTAEHTIPGGTITWSKGAAASTLSVVGLVATMTYSNNTIGTDSMTLSATLKDDEGRTVETLNRALTLRAYDPALNWVGANNIVVSGYTDQSAVATTTVSARSGANTLSVSAAKVSGATLAVNLAAGTSNTTTATTSLTALQSIVGANTGVYRFTATATWFGVSNTRTYDVRASATKSDAMFTFSGSGESKSSYNFPVVANASFTVGHSVPGGTITWSRTINSGTISDTPVANNTNYVFRTSQGAVGTLTANATVTATLRDSGGAIVDTKSVTAATSSTVSNPTLSLNGPASASSSNTFSASASLTLTPAVAAGLTGHTYSFSWVAVSGSAGVTSNSSAVVVQNSFDGAGSVAGTYDVTCSVIKAGQTIASTTERVTVTATCPAPVYNFTSADANIGNYNFPVDAYGTATASTTPAGGVITWSWVKVTGTNANLYTDLGNSRFVVNPSTSTVGTTTSQYDVTATYRTPGGTLLTTRTARVTAYATRYNPALVWNYAGVSTNNVTGFTETLQSSVSLQASANASLSGHTFRITSAYVSATSNFNNASIATNNTAGSATVTVVNTRSTHGTTQKTSQYDMSVDILKAGQVIANQQVQRTYHTITPGTVGFSQTINDYQHVWSGTAEAGFHFETNGTVTRHSSGQVAGNWMDPANTAEAANYEIKFNNGAYQQLNARRGVTITVYGNANLPNNDSDYGTYTIRHRTTLVQVGSGTYDIFVEAGQPV